MASGIITKANFNTSWRVNTSGTNPGANGTYFYICAPAIIFQMHLNQPTSIFYQYAHVYVRIRQWNGSSWDTIFDRTLRRNDSKRHAHLYHNRNYIDDSSVYELPTYGANHLFEIFCRRDQGEGEKCVWYLNAGGIGMMQDSQYYSYDNDIKGKKIYGIGGDELYIQSSSSLASTIVDTFSTSHKSGTVQITSANSDFCTETPI